MVCVQRSQTLAVMQAFIYMYVVTCIDIYYMLHTFCRCGLLPCRVIGGVCSEVEIGETVRFNVSVTVTECTEELMSATE